MKKRALIICLNELLEPNITLIYRSIFLGETVTLIDTIKNWESEVADLLIQNFSSNEFVSLFLKRPDLILFISEVHHSKIVLRLANMAKQVSPDSKILVFGRATTFIPQYFYRKPFDAIHVSGDREYAIKNYIRYIDNKIAIKDLAGLVLISNEDEIIHCKSGLYLEESEWPTPNLPKLPLQKYLKYRKNRLGKERLRISITTSKGCPYNCNYCGASIEEGRIDRRRNPLSIIKWAKENQILNNGDFIVHLFSPNIFMDFDWIEHFCEIYNNNNSSFIWRGVTRIDTIDEKILAIVSKSGCKEIAVGVEHINANDKTPLKSTMNHLLKAIDLCKKYSISLKGLLMLGLPGQTIEDISFAIALLNKNNIRYRITGYTPLHHLKKLSADELDCLFLENYNRRSYYNHEETLIDPYTYYNILCTNGGCLNG